MNTRLVIYVLLLDVFIALMSGAFVQLPQLTLYATPTYQQAQYTMGNISWTLAFPTLTLIPSFSAGPFGQFPGLVIPGFTLFSFNWGFLAPLYYDILWVEWFFETLASVIAFLFGIIFNGMLLLLNVPYVGSILTVILTLINFLAIYEILKWVRGD